MRVATVVVGLLLLLPRLAAGQETLPRCPSPQTGPVQEPGTTFVVTMLGNVLVRPMRPVTEDDAVTVRVHTDSMLAPRLTVLRTSAARRVGELRIIGLPDDRIAAQELTDLLDALTRPQCFVDATLGDFNPGLGEVEIRLVTQAGTDVRRLTLGGFDFNVEPVYAGMISLGPIVTRLADPTFHVATNAAGDTYISVAESGRDRILYALMYTPFMTGRRVAETPFIWDGRALLRRINPTFGVILNDIRRNAVAGVSVDLPYGLVAQAGWHVGRASEIDPASGLQVGSAFPQDGEIPVSRTWRTDRFVGLTLDTRVALRLLGLAGRTSIP